MSDDQLLSQVRSTLDVLLTHVGSDRQIPSSLKKQYNQLEDMDIHKALRSFLVIVENVYTQRIFGNFEHSLNDQIFLWHDVLYKSVEIYRTALKVTDNENLGDQFLRLCRHISGFYKTFIESVVQRYGCPEYGLKVLIKLDIVPASMLDTHVKRASSCAIRSIVTSINFLGDISRYKWTHSRKNKSNEAGSGAKSSENSRRYYLAAATLDCEDHVAYMKLGTLYYMTKDYLPALFYMTKSVSVLERVDNKQATKEKDHDSKNMNRKQSCLLNLVKLLDKIIDVAPSFRSPDHVSVSIMTLTKMYAEVLRRYVGRTASEQTIEPSLNTNLCDEVAHELSNAVSAGNVEPSDLCMLVLIGYYSTCICGKNTDSAMQITLDWGEIVLLANTRKSLFRKDDRTVAQLVAPLRVFLAVIRDRFCQDSRATLDAYYVGSMASTINALASKFGLYRLATDYREPESAWTKLSEERLMLGTRELCLRPVAMSGEPTTSPEKDPTAFRVACCILEATLLAHNGYSELYTLSGDRHTNQHEVADKSTVSDTLTYPQNEANEDIVLFQPRGRFLSN